MFKIIYGDVNPFKDLAPTPLVERDIAPVYYASKHGDIDSIRLKGTITGSSCFSGNEFSYLWSKGETLLNRFSKPFQNFRIIEDLGDSSGYLYTNGNAIVRSIDFEEGVYAGILPFSISLDVFREGTFANYGIMEPSQDVSYEQRENGEVFIKKTTSARGFNTDSPALENSRLFVQSLTGLNTGKVPMFIPSSGMQKSILVSLEEKINRLEGSYEVVEGWIFNNRLDCQPHSVFEKSVLIDTGPNGTSVTLNGKLKGGIGSSFSTLRDDFSAIDFFGYADEIYSAYQYGDLYVKPISKQIQEDDEEKTISFSMVYSDKFTEDPYIVDSISIEKNLESNKTCVRANIEILSTDNCPAERWSKVNEYFDSFSIVDWMKNRVSYLGYSVNLPNVATTRSSSHNEQEGRISISAAMCEKKISIPSHFDDFNYTVSATPAIPSFAPFQAINQGGDFIIQKLGGLKRKTITIQGNGHISSCSTFEQAKSSLLSRVNNIKNLYLDGTDVFITQHNIQRGYGSLKNKISFSFSWNEKSDCIFAEEVQNSTPLS